MTYVIAALFGYLLGSIPFGLVLCKIFGYGDVRNIGSGNIGATNVLRTGNKMLALATLLLDSGKGAIAVFSFVVFEHLMASPGEEVIFPTKQMLFAGFGALVGHCYPVWLKFKGGKGVATTLGTLIASQPLLGLSACGIWLLTALIFRISSLSALVAMAFMPIAAWFLTHNMVLVIFCIAVAVLVFAKHHENIARLLKGEEPKIGKKKQSGSSEA